MVKKIYKKLTKEQKERGVIFSSTLSNYREEMENDIIYEVFFGDSGGEEQINRLMNDRFFNGIANYNIIRR
jgi:hypothetical protein